jgi:radical SAM superfamily enzyme YgiQ (UPF0313 family)/MoaA/NifB/PqqE/SkfB family radical SAM enzyme
MKLAFIQAPAWGRECPPYTMCFLAALVRQNGHEAHLFDLNNYLYHTSPRELRKMWDDKDNYFFWESGASVKSLLERNQKAVSFYVDKILETEARIIGFTVHFSSAWASLEIARRIKERDKSRVIVFGGPDCSLQQKGAYFIGQGCVDIVVCAEGEKPLFDIIDKIDSLKDIRSLPGCLLLRNGLVMDGGYMAGVEDLDRLPFADYSDFKDDILLRLYREPNRLDIFDSRGCTNHCHFCSEWQFWGKFRAKSGKRIFDEIMGLKKEFPQVNFFYFSGSLINGNMGSLKEFCDLVIKNNAQFQWAGQAIIRPEMTKEVLIKLRKSGCSWISYGIESGSQRVLDAMNKRFSLDLARRVLHDTREAGIPQQVNFMFGLPTETKEESRQTLQFMQENRKYIDSILASQSFCVIDKGTYLYNKPEEFGVRSRDHHLFWESNDGENNYPERLRRYEEFCSKAIELGIPETSGVLRVKPDKWRLLGDYYFYRKDYTAALRHYLDSRKYESDDPAVLERIAACFEEKSEYRDAVNTWQQSPDRAISEGTRSLMLMIEGRVKEAVSDWSKVESHTLSRLLRYCGFSGYKGVDLEDLLGDFDFNEKQISMARALYSHGLWTKLSNYILADAQKARRDARLFSFPYWLVIDPCNYCNLSCPFCPTGQKRQCRTKGKLSLEDFKKIIDMLGPYLIHIDLVNWGEPFLNEHVIEMISYAKKYHVDIKLDTNLNHFDESKAKELVLSGLDKIVVSADGATEETYRKYRVNGDFGLAMDNLKSIVRMRKELRRQKPYITWQFLVFRHNEHEIEKARSMSKRLEVDHLGITKAFIGDKEWIPLNPEYSNYEASETKKDEPTYNHFKPACDSLCNWPWEAIAVNTNGSVSVCCSVEEEKEDFGNIFSQPFDELWNGKKYIDARDHISRKRQGISGNICVACRHSGLINVDILSCHSFFD